MTSHLTYSSARDIANIARRICRANRHVAAATLHTLARREIPVARGAATARDAVIARVIGARPRPTPALTLRQRLRIHVERKAIALIADRGGETAIGDRTIGLLDRDGGLTLVGADGWRDYGRQPSRRASLRYLVGRDDNGAWAVRCVSTVSTVAEAVESLIPAEVRRALEAGRGVARQGDIYAIEMRVGADSARQIAGTNHLYDAARRTLLHVADDARHADLVIPADWRAVKFVAQLGLRMGRAAGARRSDMRAD